MHGETVKKMRVLCDARCLTLKQSRMQERTSGPTKQEVSGGWSNLLSRKLNNVYCVSQVTGLMKSGKMRWEGT